MFDVKQTYQLEKFSKTQEEFDEFYENHIRPKIEEMQNQQQESLEKATEIGKKLFLPLILAVGLSILFKHWLFIALFFLFSLYQLRHFLNEGKEYSIRMKQEIIPMIVEFLNPNFIYEPNQIVPFRDFVTANVFTERPNRYGGDDLIHGFVGNNEPTPENPYPVKTELKFSEIRSGVEHEYEDHQGHKKSHYTGIFNGLFFVADFNKDFAGLTLVVPRGDLRRRKILTFLKLEKLTAMKEVELENLSFMEKFAVLSTDEIKARYILTPSFMERLLEFTEKNTSRGNEVDENHSRHHIFHFVTEKCISYYHLKSIISSMNPIKRH